MRVLLILPILLSNVLALAEESKFKADKFPSTSISLDTSTPLVNFNSQYLKKIRLKDTHITLVDGPQRKIKVITGTTTPWPSVFLPHPSGSNATWDLDAYQHISVDIENPDNKSLKVYLRIDSESDNSKKRRKTRSITIPRQTTKSLSVELSRLDPEKEPLKGMHSYPNGLDPTGVNPKKVQKLVVFTDRDSTSRQYIVSKVEAIRYTSSNTITVKNFYPFVDKYGQYIHANWDRYIKYDADLKNVSKDENKSISIKPRSNETNKYGAWAQGRKYKATGSFQTKKIDGNWWLIDPEGYLFWSHGIDAVRINNPTVLNDREHYFKDLPSDDNPLSQYYSPVTKKDVVRGFYKNKTGLKSYDFAKANLQRKYGNNWESINHQHTIKRLENWGINTLGLWSDIEITRKKVLPYVDWLHYWSPKINGKLSKRKKMVDMWDVRFTQKINQAAKSKLPMLATDSWCIGVFVDNELPWSDPSLFTSNVLTSPASQAAKIEFIEGLKKTYTTITKLNGRWGVNFNDWADLMNYNNQLPLTIPESDSKDFYERSIHKYYQVIQAAIKEHGPNILYLGSRLNESFPTVARISSYYVDVVSYNLYRESIKDFQLPAGVDKPVIIGEWHIGLKNENSFGGGLVTAPDGQTRKGIYTDYVTGALTNPHIIGVHWFQYMDQAITGRVLDGENYTIGFVDTTDTPYDDLVNASRYIGKNIYKIRLNQ